MNQAPVQLDAIELGQTLDQLASIGNRYAGSEGEASARDYLLDRFAGLGLEQVRLEPLQYLGFDPAPASCTVLSPERLELDCHPLQYTRGEDVAGEAIYLGEATDEDFVRLERHHVELAGKIVLAHTVFPFDLCALLQARGVAGLIHICETPDQIVGNFTGSLYPPPLSPPWEGRPTSYAGVTIGHAAGRALLSMLSYGRPVEIRIAHGGSCTERTASNVVGVLPGSGPGEVIACAHYDSQAEGPCVFDNGSGLASLLETARALLHSRPRRQIVFLASAAEEIGCWGATAYAAAHAGELAAATAMVNLDGVASSYPGQREIWSADSGLLRMALETGERQGWKPDRIHHARGTFGDHAPFGDAGVPSCLIWRPDYPYYHSRGDVRELVDERAVAETASVSATLLDRLAQGDDVPR